jgi:GNAT superfamily N-acetyltransferase
MSVWVRQLRGADALAFAALRLEGADAYPLAFMFSAAEIAAQPVAKMQVHLDAGTMWGVFVNGAMAGFGGLARHPGARSAHRAHIGPFYVTPASQGAGVSDALMEGLLREARRLSLLQLELWVAQDNPRACAFYRRHGFVQAGVIPRAILLDGVGHDDLFMVRQLDA